MYILNDLQELTRERVEVTGSPTQNGLHVSMPWRFAASASSILSVQASLLRAQLCWALSTWLVGKQGLPSWSQEGCHGTWATCPSPHPGRTASSTSPRSRQWGAHSDLGHMLTPEPIGVARPRCSGVGFGQGWSHAAV